MSTEKKKEQQLLEDVTAQPAVQSSYTTPAATLHRFGALGACEPHEQAVCPTTELDLRLRRTL